MLSRIGSSSRPRVGLKKSVDFVEDSFSNSRGNSCRKTRDLTQISAAVRAPGYPPESPPHDSKLFQIGAQILSERRLKRGLRRGFSRQIAGPIPWA